MSECIAPGLTAAADALKVVREALAMVAAREVGAVSQGTDGVPDAKEEL